VLVRLLHAPPFWPWQQTWRQLPVVAINNFAPCTYAINYGTGKRVAEGKVGESEATTALQM